MGTFSFLATGGDNFRVFTEGSNTKDSGLVDRDAWIGYLQDSSPVSPDFAREATARTSGLSVRIGKEAAAPAGVRQEDLR